MEESAVHRPVTQGSSGAGIGIGKDGLRSKFTANLFEPLRDFVVSLVPRDAIEIPWTAGTRSLRLHPAHGIQHAVGRIDAIQVLRHLGAQKPARDRMIRVSLDPGRFALLIYRDENTTRIGAIMGANGMDGFGHSAWKNYRRSRNNLLVVRPLIEAYYAANLRIKGPGRRSCHHCSRASNLCAVH